MSIDWSAAFSLLVYAWLNIVYPLILWLRKRKYGIANRRAWSAGVVLWWAGFFTRVTVRSGIRNGAIPEPGVVALLGILFAVGLLPSILACIFLRLGANRKPKPLVLKEGQ